MEIDRYDECSTGATVHRSGRDYCVFLSNAAARRREGEHLHFQGPPVERPLRSFSPLLFLHFFFVIIQPSPPFFHPPSPFFCIFHDARRRLYRNPFTSSPSVRVIPGFKLAVQSSDTSRWRARRRRQPPTNIPRLE